MIAYLINLCILVIFVSMLIALFTFLSRKYLRSKSFDEMLAEKKKMRETILGTSKPQQSKKQTRKPTKKKERSPHFGKQQPKESRKDNEEDSDSSSSTSESSQHSDMELVVPEPIIAETVALKRNVKPNQAKKVKGKSTGILINKNEPVLIKETPAAEEPANHFIESHPKDALEIHRSSLAKSEDSSDNAPKPKPKENKKNKKSEETPASPKIVPKPIVEEKTVVPVEKPMKKKKIETSAFESTAAFIEEENEISALIRQIAKSELTRNQIQILIDFLLNKQQDTIIKEPTEWLEGKADVVQKLKKQLQEKEELLKGEQNTVFGLHAKLRELRNELNAEKSQFNLTLKHHMEESNGKNIEIRNLAAELQMMNDKFNAEKQNMTVQFQQMQAKYVQMKQESLKNQENVQTIQQLTENNQRLQQDLVNNNNQLKIFLNEQHQKDESIKKVIAEFENELKQRVQDLSVRDNEIQKLNNELTRTAEIEKLYNKQKYELEQLKVQHQNQNVRVDENNKIEIRNLQNELQSYKANVEELNNKLEASNVNENKLLEYQQQVESLQSAQTQLQQQIEEQKVKNNELRTKNWKLVEALQAPTNNDSKKRDVQQPTTAAAAASTPDVNQVIADEKNKTKEIIVKYFPTANSIATDHDNWLESMLETIKESLDSDHLLQQNGNDHLNNSNTSSSKDTEAMLQNAQLKASVDEYKTIIADTEKMLKNLELKVREQDAYWKKIVNFKDEEILKLKNPTETL